MVAGKNIEPNDAAKTNPRPIANGPLIYKNLSLGAQTATVDKPPTIPAVYLEINLLFFIPLIINSINQLYHAARIKIGPPTKHNGAIIAPNIPQCVAHAICLVPTPSEYGMERATMPEPIIAPNVTNIDIQPLRDTKFIKAGVRKTAAAAAADNTIEPPK